MGKGHHRLSARFATGTRSIGRHADGGGLYLQVRKRGETIERLWLFRYRRGARGQERECIVSLGRASDVTLADARKQAERCRAALAAGQDPRQVLARTRHRGRTFGEAADTYIDRIAPGLHNAKHVDQWRMTLGDTYCRRLRRIPVEQVSTADVLAVLTPIWHTKPETAQRLRGRIERVLDAVTVTRERSGDNPARWRGHLQVLLSRPAQLSRGHHKALPWQELPAFMARLRRLDSVSARALEWTILTAARTSETTGAMPAEINTEQRIWTIPAQRMKAKREHRVPLSDRCLEILAEVSKLRGTYLFPSRRHRLPLSYMALSQCLGGLNPDVTVHGFRSTFRDWVGEATTFSEQLAEQALAHVIASKTERAYRRGDGLERRRELMAAWEDYCQSRSPKNEPQPLKHAASLERAAD